MKAYLHFISGTDGFNLVVEVGETVGSGQKILYICFCPASGLGN